MRLTPHPCYFNSIKVRLKPNTFAASSLLKGDFNSIKVRLKLNAVAYKEETKEISIP